jgi:hypothetical protein
VAQEADCVPAREAWLWNDNALYYCWMVLVYRHSRIESDELRSVRGIAVERECVCVSVGAGACANGHHKKRKERKNSATQTKKQQLTQ